MISDFQNEGLNIRIRISDSIDEIKTDWDRFNINTIFGFSNYLSLLESHGPYHYEYYYAVIFNLEDFPIAIYYFQKKKIHLYRDFRIHTHSNKFWDKFRIGFLKRFFKFINYELLVSGNVLLTGEYAFGAIEDREQTTQIQDFVFDSVLKFIKKEKGVKIQGILAKDYYTNESINKQVFNASGFYGFEVQPGMILNLKENWESFDDYINAVKSKYRVKFKKVKKKAAGLDFIELDESMAQQYNDQMYSLYKATADRATFNLFLLDKNYFSKLKSTLKDKLHLIGVFQGETLLAFYTFVNDHGHGDAHFLGYDVKQNAKFQLYFNILLKLVELAITERVKSLNLSRTALEIKSSVGAEPMTMKVYLKGTNRIINSILPWILNRVVPKNNWEQRRPFK